ncbi:MAG: O-antigen ligase family protein [Clostridia bacterium]|nr:O-antigen ligase family protein [Clostridia bacterium]
MRRMFSESIIIRMISAAAKGFTAAAHKSLLFGGRKEKTRSRESAAADWLNRLGWAEKFLRGLRESAIARRLYHHKDAFLGRMIWLLLSLGAGIAGGLMQGIGVGIACGGAMAALPRIFSIPPFWIFCALLILLPIGNTTLCWILGLILLITYLFDRAFGGAEGKPWDRSDVLLLIFPLFCVVSAALSADVADSFKVVGMWSGLFLCAPLVRRVVRSKKQLICALLWLAAGGVLSGAVGLYQYFSGMVETFWTDTALFEDLELRVYSTFANPNVYGEFLILLIPLLAALAIYMKKLLWRVLLIGAELLLLVNLGLTYSRGCYCGLALAAVVFLWYYNKKWMMGILAAAVPIIILALPETVMDRIMSIGNMADGSTAYRMYVYLGTLAMMGVYWFCGIGIGEGAYQAVYPAFSYTNIEEAPHSHSLFLQAAVSFGIMGAIYLMILFYQYQKNLKAESASLGRERLLLIGFQAVMWGFILQSLFDYTWYNYRIFQLFWILLMLGFAAPAILRSADEGGRS